MSRRRRKGETVEDFVARLETVFGISIERTYCGRVLAGKKRPGLRLRIELRDSLGISLDSWDIPSPEPDNRANRPAA